MRRLRDGMVIVLLLALTGCAIFEAKETTFLRKAQGHATQETVKQQMGAPAFMKTAQSGEALWIYQVWDWQPGNRFTANGAWCNEYGLYFDDQGILRRWTHDNYFHGGEAFPGFCIPDRVHSPPS